MPSRAAALLATGLLWLMGASQGLGAELRLGMIEVHPEVESSFEYTSNLFGTRTEKDDMVFQEEPAIRGRLNLRWLVLEGGSAWRWFQYLKRPKLMRTDPRYWGEARLDFPAFKAFVSEEYSQQAGVTFTQTLSRSAANKLAIGVSPQFKRLKVDFKFSDDSTNYKPPNLNQDLDVTRFDGKLGYPLWPKTDITGQYILGHARYPRTASRNYRAQSWYLGAEGRYWAKLTGEAKAGLELREPVDESRNEELLALVASADLQWRHSPYRTWGVRYERQFRDATFEASQTGAFLGHAVKLSLSQHLTYRLVSKWSLRYLWEKGSVPTSGDDLSAKQRFRGWTYGAEFEYQARDWLTGELLFGYSDTDSNFNDNDTTVFSVRTVIKVLL